MDLKPGLLRGIYDYGLERPSGIQQRAIPSIIRGRDALVQAQSGIDKMAALVIPVLRNLNRWHRALILSPTSELADCVRRTILALGEYMSFECHVCLGGTRVQEDKAKLQKGVHVVVGTPGRVYDMIKRGSLKVDAIKILSLDEAHEMLSRGFKDQIYDVFQLLPQGTQVVLFSTAIPKDVLEFTQKLMKDPLSLGTKQFYVAVEKEDWKLETLSDLYETMAITQAVIFCNTSTKADWLTEKMKSWEPTVSVLSRVERDAVIKRFRILTLAGRKIDDRQLSRKGVVFNFITMKDVGMLREFVQLVSFYNTNMPLNIA
ncbi:DEAD-domain-containing protein [Marasmius fiardii PR-910]|nr:DEAD-domain-containing protein [Marasmius fiardii PR-910]